MPIYEYQCGQCERTFERRQGYHDKPVSACPACGDTVRRVYQPVGIIFKGPGFYITDSRPKVKEEGSSTSGSSSSTSSSDASKTETANGASKTETASASSTTGAV